MGGVEGEVPRLWLGDADAVVGAGVVLRHADLLSAVGRHDQPRALPALEGGPQRLDQPRPRLGRAHQPIDYPRDVGLLVALEWDLLAELVHPPVDPDAGEALLAD